MWISEPYRVLDKIDVEALITKVLSLPETTWHLDETIQKRLTQNRQVDSIYLKWMSKIDFSTKISKRPLQTDDVSLVEGWSILHKDLDTIVDTAIAHFPAGGVVTRIQLARLNPGSQIRTHFDSDPMLIAAHRLHIPLTSNDGVEFLIDGERVVMSVGSLYELNNRLWHSVINNGTQSRIHLLIDYLPPLHNLSAAMAPSFEKKRKQRVLNKSNPPAATRFDYPLPKVIATSVIRGANKNESHGGIYLIDLSSEEVEQVLDWDACDIDWGGRGWDRGLRGIATYDEHIYVAASDELYCFDKTFNIVSSYRNKFLKHAHEIFCHGDHILVTSTGFDSVLSFNLKNREFDKGWTIRRHGQGYFNLSLFDPKKNGPEPGNTVHINNVVQNSEGIFVSGRGIPYILCLNETNIGPWAHLPLGTHNAMPYEKGVLYNDTNADLIVLENDTKICCLDVPRYPNTEIKNIELGDDKLARQAFGRGLCAYREEIIFAGSSPSTITAYDLRSQGPIKSINITMDIRNAIHGLAIWKD